jgi:hypothetical protein
MCWRVISEKRKRQMQKTVNMNEIAARISTAVITTDYKALGQISDELATDYEAKRFSVLPTALVCQKTMVEAGAPLAALAVYQRLCAAAKTNNRGQDMLAIGEHILGIVKTYAEKSPHALTSIASLLYEGAYYAEEGSAMRLAFALTSLGHARKAAQASAIMENDYHGYQRLCYVAAAFAPEASDPRDCAAQLALFAAERMRRNGSSEQGSRNVLYHIAANYSSDSVCKDFARASVQHLERPDLNPLLPLDTVHEQALAENGQGSAVQSGRVIKHSMPV